MKTVIKLLVVMLCLFLGFQLYRSDNAGDRKGYGKLEIDRAVKEAFEAAQPTGELFLAESEDLDADDIPDYLLFYTEPSQQKNFMVALVKTADGFRITEPVPAPIDDVKVQFKNIDDKDRMEFIVSGAKNGNYGYAIFRLEEDFSLRDLFNEDMENCC